MAIAFIRRVLSFLLLDVAQICNLLYRRFSTCGRRRNPSGLGMGTVRRLQIGDTAD